MTGKNILIYSDSASPSGDGPIIITYPGRRETYTGSITIMDPKKRISCNGTLEDVTLNINPATNRAGTYTTIRNTNFDGENSSASMTFVDLSKESSNPITFALWDPSISSYKFSMNGKACDGKYYTLKSQISVQLPDITFNSQKSLCSAAQYDAERNVIGFTDKNPCFISYDISSPYSMEHRSLQIYRYAGGYLKTPSGNWQTLSLLKPMRLSPGEGSQSIEAGEAKSSMGFSYFSAPYYSRETCAPNVTDTTESQNFFKATEYDYSVNVENYLLIRGRTAADLWVPFRKSSLEISSLKGKCKAEGPCGMGLEVTDQPWEVSSTIDLKEDTDWVQKAVPPSWRGKTSDVTASSGSAVCVTTYISVDDDPDSESEVPADVPDVPADPSHIYWYYCPYTSREFFDSKVVENDPPLSEFKLLEQSHGDELKAAVPPPMQDIALDVGDKYHLSVYGRTNKVPFQFGPKVDFHIEKKCSELNETGGKFVDPPSEEEPFVQEEKRNRRGGLILLLGFALPIKKIKAIRLLWTWKQKAKTALRLEGSVLVGGALVSVQHNGKTDDKQEEERKKEGDTYRVTLSKRPPEGTVVKYDPLTNLVSIGNIPFQYSVMWQTVKERTVPKQYFGILPIIKSGTLQAHSLSGSYTVYDFSLTRASNQMDLVQDIKKFTPSTTSSAPHVINGTIEFPRLYAVPAYATACQSAAADEYNVITSYSWSDIVIEANLVSKSETIAWWTTAASHTVTIKNIPDLICSTDGIKKCGVGVNATHYSNPWAFEMGGTTATATATVTTGDEPVLTSLKCKHYIPALEKKERYILKAGIDPEGLNEPPHAEEEEFWVMCPTKEPAPSFVEAPSRSEAYFTSEFSLETQALDIPVDKSVYVEYVEPYVAE